MLLDLHDMRIENVEQTAFLEEHPMTARTSSLVHPKYKTKYSVGNWPEYERGLRARGDVMIWFNQDAIAGWIPCGRRKRGAQRFYSDLAIETALTTAARASFAAPSNRRLRRFVTSVDGPRPSVA